MCSNICQELDARYNRYKRLALFVADCLDPDFPDLAARMSHCGDWLYMADNKLVAADFCRARLCPMCQWRRSVRLYHDTIVMLDACPSDVSYIMITLTVRNCSADNLGGVISDMFHAWQRLTQRKRVRAAWLGWLRSLEITYNLSDNTWHPHIHAIVAVPRSYYSGRLYISQSDYSLMWSDCMRVNYSCIIDVRRVRDSERGIAGAVAECCKYAVKPGAVVDYNDVDLSRELLGVLQSVLCGRRLVAYGGLFRQIRRKLALPDQDPEPEPGTGEDLPESVIAWFWSGVRYVRVSGFRGGVKGAQAPPECAPGAQGRENADG